MKFGTGARHKGDRDRRKPPPRGTAASVQPSMPMVAFTEGSILLGILLGSGIRLRIFLDSPLRPSQPLLWGLHGFLQDLTIYSLVGALALFSTRYFWQRRSWSVLTGFVLVVCVLHLLWSEIVVFFGHAVRARDLQVGLRPVMLLRSVKVDILFTFAGLVLVSWFLIRWTARRARRTGRTWATTLRLFVLGLAGGALSAVPISIHQAETARNPLVALAVLIRDWPPADAEGHFVVPRPSLAEVTLRDLAPQPRARIFFDNRFPLAYHAPSRSPRAPAIPSGLKPNLVFLVMEGVRSEEIGSYGGPVRGLTPNLDELAREGIRVDRFYSNGSHTPEGELALWYGLLPSPYELLITTRSDVPMAGLPEMLLSAGWRSFLWIHNGDQNFYRRDRFYSTRGFRSIDGRDFPTHEPRTNWGYSDRALARRALLVLDNAAEPFAAMVLTVSNHHPFQVPSDARTQVAGLPPARRGFVPFGHGDLNVGMHTVPMLRTIHYTDEAIGDFFEAARTRPWFSRTVFVILGDHGLPIAPMGGLHTFHRFIELRHRVPLILFSSLLAGGRVLPGPASQIDLLPTLAGLFGIPGDRAGIGRDLLDPDSEDPNRPVITWTRDAQTISVVTEKLVYHRQIANESPLRFQDSADELLIDPIRDPEGRDNLLVSEPKEALPLVRAAQTYFDVYPWVVVQGRSGLPSIRSTPMQLHGSEREGGARKPPWKNVP